jgi:hypothetical protein
MNVFTAGRVGRRPGGSRRLVGTVGVGASVALALAVAAPAWASPSATGTLAPIGSGSYLLSLTNTGSETITEFAVEAATTHVSNIVPSPACKFGTPSTKGISCIVTIAPGAMTRMCYTGPALRELELTPGQSSGSGSWGLLRGAPGSTASLLGLKISPAPAVAACPLPGFTVGHPWSHALCKSTYKAWTKKHNHATRSQKKAEANKLRKAHGCPLSILK